MKLQLHVRRGKTLCAECNMPIVFDREARIITHEVNTPDCLEAVGLSNISRSDSCSWA